MNWVSLLSVSRFVVYALATFRITYMLWIEDGPFDMFDWLRYKVGVVVTRDGVRGDNNTTLGRLFNCPLCLSVWVGALMTACCMVNIAIIDYVAMVFALSAVCMILVGYERVTHE